MITSLLTRDVTLNWSGLFAGDRLFEPDDTKAYCEVYLCHALPALIPSLGTALHPDTVANSYRSLLDQQVNFSHLVKAYDPENIPRDRIIGHVAHVEFPPRPESGWASGAPGIRAILAIAKQAEGVDRFLGGHQSGKKAWSVSIEFLWDHTASGFLLERDATNRNAAAQRDLLNLAETPEDLRRFGYHYLPWAKAPADLQGCWSDKKKCVNKTWHGLKPVMLQAGLNGSVQYMGIGITQSPAEPSARISQTLASDELETLGLATPPLRNLSEMLKKLLTVRKV